MSCVTYGNSNQVVNVTYCYENKPLLPHFLGSGPDVPMQHPGPSVEILQHLEKLTPNVKITFVRFPWKRCLNDLQTGKVDAVIGSYNKLREQIGRYPKTKKGEIDTDRNFSTTSSCLLYPENDIVRDGHRLLFEKPMSMSVPSGYGVITDMKRKGFDVYQAPSSAKAHELLFSGRVGASLSNCFLENLPVGFVQNTTPINQSTGYLLFSHQFYQRNSNLAETLWHNITLINRQDYYKRYRDSNLNNIADEK